MPKTLTIATKLNPSLIAFTPRQLLLASSTMTNNSIKPCSSLKAEQKTLLLSSLAQYLERNGFSKTLKKFRSEAQIEKDGLKDSPPDLEEIFKKYLETCNHDIDVNSKKDQVTQKEGLSKTDGEGDTVVAVEAVSKKKKKRSDDNDGHAKSEEMITNDTAPGLNIKSKEKKKSKKVSDSLDQGSGQVNSEVHKEPAHKIVSESLLEEPKKRDKENKKKKSKDVPETLGDTVENQLDSESKAVSKSEKETKSKDKKKKKKKKSLKSKGDGTDDKKDDIKTEVDVAAEETKASKKRKRLAPEENDSQFVDVKAVEESKRRKTGVDANAAKENKGENGQIGSGETAKTPMKQLNGRENGDLEKSVEKSSKKQRNGSAEPTTVKAFQRVKVDEVVFTDERLQDNSYWAKDGADIGYGAKAQEVLGQVRGRDFRHEKTKKKRGSYRGGQIDLQSHSVKFNYDDE